MAIILAIPALLSLLLLLWQWLAAWRFPLHRRTQTTGFTPAVTLLKPLKGLDINTITCLRSWLNQEYAQNVQILFGVASADDPVCEPLRRLLAENPKWDAQLVVYSESLGINAKVSTLIQLSRLARHEVIVISDADVLAPPDFLRNAVAPLEDPKTGLVNSFYRFANPTNVSMRWEALAVNADFWSQVLQGASLQPLDFALGAAMVTRREQLAAIGGFEALADFLADDYQLGNRIVRIAGKRIALCPVTVDCLSHPMNWREVWSHQLRWARTIRACKPLPYAFSILSNPTFWPALWIALQPSKFSTAVFLIALWLRIVSAQALQSRLGHIRGQGYFWWLAPVKDLLQFAIWVLAFAGHHITWRGQRFRLQRDGRLARN